MIVSRPRPEVSVVIPAHNEVDNLPPLIEEIARVRAVHGLSLEIVVVDDGSSDNTPARLEELATRYDFLSPRRMQWRAGQSAALSAGFDVAQGDVIITMDADGQNDPADIPKLLDALETADVAIGWRRDRKDPFSKKIISKIANGVRNWATSESVRDTGCGLKAFKREVIDAIHRFDGMHRFFPTLARMHGFSIAEAVVNHRPRVKGKTHYNIFNRSIRPIRDLFGIRWLQRRTLRYQLEREPALVERH